MKDKISMAIKDPVLQQGFEIICKNLAELEKENAEFHCQMNRNKFCYSCINATDKCFKNEIGCPCEKYKSYKDENAELKSKNCWKTCDYVEPKSQWVSQHIQDIVQLAKAKEIIKKFSEFVNNEVEFDPEHPQEHTDLWNELCEEAEQFLNEARAMEGQND